MPSRPALAAVSSQAYRKRRVFHLETLQESRPCAAASPSIM
jgi:hypothetical protein